MSVSVPSPPDILSPEHAVDPYSTYRVLREHHPVVFHQPTQSWLVRRYADLRALFRAPAISSDNYDWQLEPVHGRTILQMEGREHTATGGCSTRSSTEVVSRASAPPSPRTRASSPTRSSSGRRGRWPPGREVDLVTEFTQHFPINVIEDMLAIPKQDTDRFERWYVSIMRFLSNLSGDEAVAQQGLRTKQELDEYFFPIIAERRSRDGEDLISRFCRAEVDGTKLSDAEIRGSFSLMLTAGGETTDRALASLFKNLIEHPDQLRAVREDRSLVVDAFAETLRYSPPVHMIMRHAKADMEIGGVAIPAGSTITCLLAAGNRDPERFADPSFDIFRTDNSTEKSS